MIQTIVDVRAISSKLIGAVNMPELNPKRLSIYIYLDVEGIESLYAQTADRVEVEITETHKQEGKGAVGFKAGFGNLLSTLIGVKGLDAETKVETIRGQIQEAKSRLSIENKLTRLSEYLIQSKQCYEDFVTAAENARVPGVPVFLRTEQKFDAPDFLPGRGGVEAINESKAMVFAIEPHHDESDNYFKTTSPYRCIMSASLDKCLRIKGSMYKTSHEAVAFRGLDGKNIPLGVFGCLLRFNSSVCQIKPFAIWFATNPLK